MLSRSVRISATRRSISAIVLHVGPSWTWLRCQVVVDKGSAPMRYSLSGASHCSSSFSIPTRSFSVSITMLYTTGGERAGSARGLKTFQIEAMHPADPGGQAHEMRIMDAAGAAAFLMLIE